MKDTQVYRSTKSICGIINLFMNHKELKYVELRGRVKVIVDDINEMKSGKESALTFDSN